MECFNCGVTSEPVAGLCSTCKAELIETEADALALGRSIMVTTAPDAYDGFGTQTIGFVSTVTTPSGRMRVYRKIAVKPEHLEWQKGRNASGLYATLTLEQYAEWEESGIL